jgi:hypothetical protein
LKISVIASKNQPLPEKKFRLLWQSPVFLKRLSFAGVTIIILIMNFFIFEPVWSQMRERIRRFFMITKIENSVPTSKQFWSTLNQNEIIPSLPLNSSLLNSLSATEQNLQKIPPSGFNSMADYIISLYHLNSYSSLTEILKSTPAKILREESYYTTGKLYILAFPEGLISYTELTVPTSKNSTTTIRSIR